MGLRKINSSWLLLMFLFSPLAWGDSEGLGIFVSRIHKECTQTFAKRLVKRSALSPTNRERLASALCEDDRVFWPFAQAQAPELAPRFEDEFRSQRAFAPPIILGLVGSSPQETDEILQAVNATFYPASAQVLKWTGQRGQVRDWQDRMDGGLLGGVIHVNVEGNSDPYLQASVRVARDAISYTVAHHMDSYVLVISSRRDVRALFPEGGEPIRWILLESSDCEGHLRNQTH